MTGFLWSDDADAFFGDSMEGKPQKQSKPGTSQDAPLTVSQLNEWIKRALDQSIPTVWIAAEISNLTQSAAGHVYLTLKDPSGQISAVVWRSTLERIGMDITEGMAVLVQGRLDVYSPRGSYQLVIQRMEQQGVGALQAAFRRLFQKLDREGLFASERKKTLPRFPRRIGFVTSPAGAAIHDFCQVLGRRWPNANVLIIPSKVQGEGAAEEIVRGIRVAARIQPVLDILVVGRGGGSVEDLWCFNEEIVVRALVDCPIPTVSAVGHEIDVTLSDLAADVRALTPTEAAEIVAPSKDELLELFKNTESRINSLVQNHIQRNESKLRSLATRAILEDPARLLESPTQLLDDVFRDLDAALDKWFENTMKNVQSHAQMLEALSPLKTLARGYSVTHDKETSKIVNSVESVKVGQSIVTRVSSGEIESVVTKITMEGTPFRHGKS